MCISPVTIKNPVYGRTSYQMAYGSMRSRDARLQSKKEWIEVPCGTCAECRNTYYDSILQRGIVESLTSYLYFITLTYDNDHLPCLQLPNGEIIYYADYSHIQAMFKRFRAAKILDRDFRYLCCNEYGDKHNRPHFHIIMFVAKKDDDDDTTPLYIEQSIFNNLGNYFALNIGTRKKPIYERLFTYRIRFTPKGIKSNYYVKLVQNEYDPYNRLLYDNLTYVKTLRYLLGYVNKGSSFDDKVKSALTDLKDVFLVKKLKTILMSRVRFSKGFGFGFSYGSLFYIPSMVKKCSYIKGLYSTSFYPSTFEEFIDSYTLCDFNRKLITFDFSMKNLKEDDLYFYFALLKYFPNFVSYKNRIFRVIPIDCLSYHFTFNWYKYVYKYNKCKTSHLLTYNYLVDFIRTGIQLGFYNKIPYLTFPLYSDNKFMSLCNFYKERFVTDDDMLLLYDILGVNDFDEWLNLFVKHTSTFKLDKQMSRLVSHDRELLQVNCCSSQIVDNLLITFFTK